MLRPDSCRVFHFADFEADVHAGQLRRDGVRVPLQEQPFQVLAALLERPGELVWREDLRQQVWPRDTFVEFDHALNTAVKKIRIALGDCATSPCYIETIPKRGYRFVAPVKVGPVHGGELFSAVGRPRRTVRGLTSLRSWSGSPLHVALAATILLSVVFLGMRWRAASPHLREEHIAMAVLPLEDWSHDSSGMSLCDGISEELVTELGRVEPSRLTVAPRALTLPYRHTSKTVAEVAHDLHANYLLEGNLRGDGHHVRVTMELIRVRDQARIWGDNFDREAGDPLALESEIADAIAAKVKPVLLAGMARDR